MQAIARFSTEPVRDTLLRFLEDPHKMVRQAAVEGLASLTIPVPSAPIAALLRDPDLMVQTRAIETMIKLNDPGSVRSLLKILQDESEHARRAAVEVLNAIGDVSAIKDLLQAMKDQDWWVRGRAADALGAIGGPKGYSLMKTVKIEDLSSALAIFARCTLCADCLDACPLYDGELAGMLGGWVKGARMNVPCSMSC